jgi:hypothetical protein
VSQQATQTERLGEPGLKRVRDGGVTYVEVLVCIVLLGTVVLATLAASQAAIIGGRVERDHARAHEWLQSAISRLEAVPRAACSTDIADAEPSIRQYYQDELQAPAVVPPPGWSAADLTVLSPVRFWDGAQYWSPSEPGAPLNCATEYDGGGHLLQLLTIQVADPDGDIIETVEVVKGATS